MDASSSNDVPVSSQEAAIKGKMVQLENPPTPTSSIGPADQTRTELSMKTTRQENPQLASAAQLQLIDKLRDLGLDDHVELPQLVVVGDQSSGKSSVLKALSGLPFACSFGLCTRFATQISMQRHDKESIKVSIRGHSTNASKASGDLKAFRREFFKSSLEESEFEDIIKDAYEFMNLVGYGGSTRHGQATFSKDVLHIEQKGPNHPNLTVIDIPGIFHNPTTVKNTSTKITLTTTKADMQLVEEMVRSYIENTRTVILAIILAPNDIATQRILTMVEEVDKNGLRTLKVFTKPDLVDLGSEQSVIDRVLGKEEQQGLGYCIVRNPGQSEQSWTSSKRNSEEAEFFRKSPWSILPKERVGIKAVQAKVQKLLEDVTRKELPKVRKEINNRLKNLQRLLTSMGHKRENADEQRQYLLKIAQSFETLREHALDAFYDKDDILDKLPTLKLPLLILDRNKKFCNDIRKIGHIFQFNKTEGDSDDEGTQRRENEGQERSASSSYGSSGTQITTEFDSREFAELEEVMAQNWAPLKEQDDTNIDVIIEAVHQQYAGSGVLPFHTAIFPKLWKQQSHNWESLSAIYIRDVIFFVHRFIHTLLDYLCPDRSTRSNIEEHTMSTLLERYKRAIDHVTFIVSVERSGRYRAPLSQSYVNISTNYRQNAAVSVSFEDTNGLRWLDPTALVEILGGDKPALQTHAYLKAYHKIASGRFIDTVCMQAAQFHLLDSEEGPLHIFTVDFVAKLSPEQLEDIAGEEPFAKQKRQNLEREIKQLEEGKKLLRF